MGASNVQMASFVDCAAGGGADGLVELPIFFNMTVHLVACGGGMESLSD
jgi:hypothetical protein